MLRTALRNLRRAALVGSLALAAGSSASAGWLCGWCAPVERPWYNPCNEPNWGVEETRWRRFPQTAYHGGMQGSYCGTGGCPTPGATMAPAVNGMAQPVMPGHTLTQPAQPNATLQRMIIPAQPAPANMNPGYPLNPGSPQNGAVPIFPAPTNSVPQMNGQPSQFDNQIFTPHEMEPIPGGQPTEMMAPAPIPAQGNATGGTSNGNAGSGVGAPVPMPGELPGGTPMPDNILPPQPLPNGGGNPSGNPIPPMDGGLPPMPQAGYFNSPFHVAGYQGSTATPPAASYPAAPGYGGYGGNAAAGGAAYPAGGSFGQQNQPVQNYPTQNYPVNPQQMPTATQYPNHVIPQSPAPQAPQPRLPFKGISFSSDPAAPKTSRNPFRAVSRLWSRKKQDD